MKFDFFRKVFFLNKPTELRRIETYFWNLHILLYIKPESHLIPSTMLFWRKWKVYLIVRSHSPLNLPSKPLTTFDLTSSSTQTPSILTPFRTTPVLLGPQALTQFPTRSASQSTHHFPTHPDIPSTYHWPKTQYSTRPPTFDLTPTRLSNINLPSVASISSYFSAHLVKCDFFQKFFHRNQQS